MGRMVVVLGKWSRLKIQVGGYYKWLCKDKSMNKIAQCGKIMKMK